MNLKKNLSFCNMQHDFAGYVRMKKLVDPPVVHFRFSPFLLHPGSLPAVLGWVASLGWGDWSVSYTLDMSPADHEQPHEQANNPLHCQFTSVYSRHDWQTAARGPFVTC